MERTNKNEPLVSIIIPNYNHARYVADAIRSVLAQEYRNFEIIVVDDGSKDNSREIIDAFGDKVHAIYQQNQGLSAARNTGINTAKGSYIGVLDADDMYEPIFLNTLIDVLQSNPQADGVYCGYQFVDEKNRLLPQIETRAVPADGLHDALLDGNFLVPESILVGKHCYDSSGPFDVTLRACEDWDMWLRFTKKHTIIHTDHVLIRHRVLVGSMSTDPSRMLTARLAVLNKHAGAEPLDGGSSPAHRVYGRAYLGACVEYLQYGNANRAYECFQKMSNICPKLLTEVDTFYQLGCGDQPKGSMGDLSSLDVKRNSAPLLAMMKKLFLDEKTSPAVKRLQRGSYARAFFTLGRLAYGAGRFGEVRQFFARAVMAKPTLVFNRQLVGLWLKSLLGHQVIDRLKKTRNNIALFR